MKINLILIILVILLSFQLHANSQAKKELVVGSKTFTESYILAEIMAQIIDGVGEARAKRKPGIGGTGLLYEALVNHSIDLYPEYTGTISEAILKRPDIKTISDLKKELKPIHLTLSQSLGFNNTYALAVSAKLAREKNLKNLSDLKKHPVLRAGLTHEFLKRKDGYESLKSFYDFNLRDVKGVSHTVAYNAIKDEKVDLIDVYATDANIEKYDLKILKDDKNFFPNYQAVILAQKSLVDQFPKTWAALERLSDQISETDMIKMNAAVDVDKREIVEVASEYIRKNFKQEFESHKALESLGHKRKWNSNDFWLQTFQHAQLVSLALLLSLLVGLPVGFLAARSRFMGQVLLLISGLLQTIPSLALLCFLIPLMGIGKLPALTALFLYGLLPIVVNTSAGIKSVDVKLIESAKSLGLTKWQLWYVVELPLSSRGILAGIKTSAITSIGTATLAALIGAGGYGVPIMTGLALNDTELILTGAVPAAFMAILAHGFFVILDKILIPKGLGF